MRLLLALALLLLTGRDAPVPLRPAQPALWVVRDADTTLYLFGTVHMLPADLDWLRGPVRAAFERSDTLMTELVLPPEAELQALVRRLGGNATPLPARLSPQEATRVAAALRGLGLDARLLDGDEPWLAAVKLSVLPLQRLGYSEEAGADTVLTRVAYAAHKPQLGLETAEEQFGAFDTLSEPAQRRFLAATVAGVPEAGSALEATVSAWARGDMVALDRIAEREIGSDPELAAALIRTRNARWAAKLGARMQRPGTVFVAVGAGHLAGRDGLPALLSRSGLVVTRVQ